MKILLIHASAGAGHLKAAEAIYQKLKESTDHDVVFEDALNFTSKTYKKLYSGTYTFLISKIPSLWAFFFAVLDIPFMQGVYRFLRRCYNGLNARGVEEYLKQEQFDCIISTHFMPTEIMAALKRKGAIKSKLITVVTDYDVHRIWTADGIDHYAVACEFTHERILSFGIPANKVTVTGIPTNEKFSKHYDRNTLKEKLGLKKDAFTVLVATGSFGIGPIEKIINLMPDFQIVVVCGHNKDLFNRLTQANLSHVKICGLVDNMHELMAVADAMVTKPGGLSISEALVSQLPMIFFSAIPGQESNNVKVLKQYHIGISGCSLQEMKIEIEKLRSSRDEYVSVLKRTQNLARPNAVRDIIGLLS